MISSMARTSGLIGMKPEHLVAAHAGDRSGLTPDIAEAMKAPLACGAVLFHLKSMPCRHQHFQKEG